MSADQADFAKICERALYKGRLIIGKEILLEKKNIQKTYKPGVTAYFVGVYVNQVSCVLPVSLARLPSGMKKLSLPIFPEKPRTENTFSRFFGVKTSPAPPVW